MCVNVADRCLLIVSMIRPMEAVVTRPMEASLYVSGRALLMFTDFNRWRMNIVVVFLKVLLLTEANITGGTLKATSSVNLFVVQLDGRLRGVHTTTLNAWH